jgi:hypothetical protein
MGLGRSDRSPLLVTKVHGGATSNKTPKRFEPPKWRLRSGGLPPAKCLDETVQTPARVSLKTTLQYEQNNQEIKTASTSEVVADFVDYNEAVSMRIAY